MVKASDPVVVEELTPGLLSLGEIQRVLQALLDESVAVRDLTRIFEALSTRARASTDFEGLVEAARATLGPAISSAYAVDGRLAAITLDPLLEQTLLEALRAGENGTFLAVDAMTAEALALGAARAAEGAEQRGETPVLLCSPQLRPAVRKLVRAAHPRLPVLSYAEVGANVRLETMGVVNGVHAAA